MDNWIFQTARKICMALFAGDILIHAIIGASTVNGILKGTISMGIMFLLLIVLSRQDEKKRVDKSRKKRKKQMNANIKKGGMKT